MPDENSEVKKEVFKELKEYEDKKVSFIIPENHYFATWSFNSNEITHPEVGLTPKLEISTERFDNIKSEEVEDGIFIKFLHNGYLPGKAEVLIYSEEAFNKYGDTEKTLNLYYYNPEKADYENAGTVKYEYGELKFSIYHCSDYVATELGLQGKTNKVIEGGSSEGELGKGPEAGAGNGDKRPLDDEPKAGDSNILVFSTFIAISALAGIVVLSKKD